MYIRCARCRSTIWFQPTDSGVSEIQVGCLACKQPYRLGIAAALGACPREQYRRAAEFAEAQGLDLPGSYSVLLGLMSLEAARVPAPSSGSSNSSTAGNASPAGVGVVQRDIGPDEAPLVALDLDEGFRSAIEAGFLTESQARERGDRPAWAARIARRHGLPIEYAYAISDNRITVRGALAAYRAADEEAGGRRPIRQASTSTLARGLAVVAFLAFALIAVSISRRPVSPGPTELHDRTPVASNPEVEVIRDEQDRVTRIVAGDPLAVVHAYCRSAPEGVELQPLGVAETEPPSPGLRLGLFAHIEDNERLYEIRIRLDRSSNRWIAGKGGQPIATTPAAAGRNPSGPQA